MCQVNRKEMKVGLPTVRRFGVELEGYVSNSIYGDVRLVNSKVTWDIDSDGSLDGGGECGDCDGHGHYSCGQCEGDGWLECSECCGSGLERCSRCDDGYNECSHCDGEGDIDGETCEHCDGDGKIKCEHCDDEGDVACRYCDNGRVDCDRCDGEGDVECCECDGSGYYGNGNYGIEAKCPPLKDTTSIHEMYEYLHRHDWNVDESAGLHVHVEADDYENEDFRKMLALMVGLEPVIYAMNDRYRLTGTSYCRPITNKRENVMRILTTPLDSHTGIQFAGGNRYHGLNFEAFRAHDTIEFRYFSPQEDSDNVEHFVELCTKLVEFVKHASMEQIIVIVKKLIQNRDNYEAMAHVVKETFELSFTPWNESYYRTFGWFTLADVERMEEGMGLVAAEQVEQAI